MFACFFPIYSDENCLFFQVVHAYYNNVVSKDNCVFVGGMPKEWTLVRVLNYLMHFGPIITAKIMTRKNGGFEKFTKRQNS